MPSFILWLVLTALLIGGGTVWSVAKYNDTLHPLVYLLPMAGFIYVYMPGALFEKGGFSSYFTLGEVGFVQGVVFMGITGLVLGAMYGSQGLRRDPKRTDVLSFMATPEIRQVLMRLGIMLGIVGLLSYSYQLYNVGGFVEAYDSVKAGGWAGSGYLRDLDYLLVPAVVLVYLSQTDRRLKFHHWLLIGVFSFPFAARGLLTARRGPTFVFFAVVVGAWYLTRRRRPSVPTMAAGGTLIGLLLLALVTFRGQIYLGSPFFTGEAPRTEEVVESSLEWATTPSLLNEYMYGSYVVLNAREKQRHYWGTRYLTQLFVRPIPSAFWPDKYEAVGMEEIKQNSGQLLTESLENHPRIPNGAAPGFVGGAYVEWGLWLAPVFLFGVGWLYACAWRKTLVEGGLWTVMYVILLAMSAYFVAQSFYAIFYRLLLMGIPPVLGWYALRPRSSPSLSKLHRQLTSSVPATE